MTQIELNDRDGALVIRRNKDGKIEINLYVPSYGDEDEVEDYISFLTAIAIRGYDEEFITEQINFLYSEMEEK